MRRDIIQTATEVQVFNDGHPYPEKYRIRPDGTLEPVPKPSTPAGGPATTSPPAGQSHDE